MQTTMLKNFLCLLIVFICLSGNGQILKKPIPGKLVVLSFDDAPASDYSIVAPLLKQFGFGATFFVCEFPPKFKDSSLYMNWRQIKALDEMGFEIASHTKTHALVSQITKAAFLKELEYIEDKCDSLHIKKSSSFAYPSYYLSLPVIETLKEKGYKFARAGGSRAYDPLHDNPFLVPSWAVNDSNKAEIIKAFPQAKNGKIVVLTIHGVPDVEHPWVTTSPALFKEYLQYLSDNHFKVISFSELHNYINTDEAMKTIAPDFNKELKNN